MISLGSAVGTYLVLTIEEPTCKLGSLKLALWLVFSLHLANVTEFFFNLTGLDVKCCNQQLLCGYFIFEVTVLVYM